MFKFDTLEFAVEINKDSESELSMAQRQHIALKMSSSERLTPGGREEPPTHS
jgi:hypothetical protein